METKTYIYIDVLIGSTLGSFVGSVIDHGNLLGVWSIVFGGIGAILGIWAGSKLGD